MFFKLKWKNLGILLFYFVYEKEEIVCSRGVRVLTDSCRNYGIWGTEGCKVENRDWYFEVDIYLIWENIFDVLKNIKH